MADSTSPIQQIAAGSNAVDRVNENFDAASPALMYGRDARTTAGLTWGYVGGRWGGAAIASGTVALTASATNYVVVNRSTGAVSASTSNASWNDAAAYARAYLVEAGVSSVTNYQDHRAGPAGLQSEVSAGSQTVTLADEAGTSTLPTAGTPQPIAAVLQRLRSNAKWLFDNDGQVVHRTGAETIAGIKTFVDDLVIDNPRTTGTTAAVQFRATKDAGNGAAVSFARSSSAGKQALFSFETGLPGSQTFDGFLGTLPDILGRLAMFSGGGGNTDAMVILGGAQIGFGNAVDARTAPSIVFGLNGSASFANAIRPGQFTLGTLPSASAYPGYYITVTDATGGPKLCRSSGTIWQIANTTTTVS